MKQLFQSLMAPTGKWRMGAPLINRMTIALVLFPHGAQLMTGWFGGPGFSTAMTTFTDVLGLPWLIAFLTILVQFLGPLLLIAGIATRIVALIIAGMFVGMIFFGHLEHGFFMNWFGQQKGEGFEFHLLMIGLSLTLVVSGAGKWSVDERNSKKVKG